MKDRAGAAILPTPRATNAFTNIAVCTQRIVVTGPTKIAAQQRTCTVVKNWKRVQIVMVKPTSICVPRATKAGTTRGPAMFMSEQTDVFTVVAWYSVWKTPKIREQTERLGYDPHSAKSGYRTTEQKRKYRQSHKRNSLGRAAPTADPLPLIETAYARLLQDNILKALRESTEEKSTVRAAVLDLEFVQLLSSADVVVLEAAMVHFLDASRALINTKVNPLPEGHATGLQNFLVTIAPKQSANRHFLPQEAFQRVHDAEDAEWDDAAYTSLCATLPSRTAIEEEIVGLIRREKITHIIHHGGPEPAFVQSLDVSVELLDSQHVYRLINSCHSGAGPKVPEGLGAVYKAIFGRELEGAHLALNDVQATAECLHAVLQQFEKVHQKC